jgi:hypothetical protein
MKDFKTWIIFTVFLLFCISTVSAFSVSSVSIDPPGDLSPGIPVTLSYKVETSGAFPSDHEIQCYTDIVSPRWTYTVVVNGVENRRPSLGGRTMAIAGFELSYKSSDEVSIIVTLDGNASSTPNALLVRVQEMDGTGQVISSTVYQLYQTVRPVGAGVSRSIPSTIRPGSQFTIGITPNEPFYPDPGWRAQESIPFGFTFVSTTAFYTLHGGPNSYTFIQNNSNPFSYIIRAPSTEGPYFIDGAYMDGNRDSGVILGDTVIKVGTANQNYRNETTGKVEKVDAQRAMTDFMRAVLSNQEAGSVLENYFLGQ